MTASIVRNALFAPSPVTLAMAWTHNQRCMPGCRPALTMMVCMRMSRTGCWPRNSSRICFPSLVTASSRGDRLDTSTPRPARPCEVRMAALGG